jgi:hypothetical protein
VFALDFGGAFDVRDGSGDFEDAIVGAGGETEAGDGVFQELFAFGVDGAVLTNVALTSIVGWNGPGWSIY